LAAFEATPPPRQASALLATPQRATRQQVRYASAPPLSPPPRTPSTNARKSSGDAAARAVAAAGIDIILHGNGNMDEMRAVADAAPALAGAALIRGERALAGRPAADDADLDALSRRLDDLLQAGS
ncbi:MAG: hypothetical protein ABGW90_06235, partial [Martelella sp.]